MNSQRVGNIRDIVGKIFPDSGSGSDCGRIKTVQLFFLNTKKSLSDSEVEAGTHVTEYSGGLVFVASGVTKHLIKQSHQWKED